jgi:hypothetical protein
MAGGGRAKEEEEKREHFSFYCHYQMTRVHARGTRRFGLSVAGRGGYSPIDVSAAKATHRRRRLARRRQDETNIDFGPRLKTKCSLCPGRRMDHGFYDMQRTARSLLKYV